MQQYLIFAAIGLGFGSIYAALAAGVVVTHRGTGVINFAAGSFATWAAYVADELVRRGDLVLPMVALPHRIDLGDTVPSWVAVALGTASTAVLGVATYLLVFRPLRKAPILAKVVGSVGVMLTIQGLVVLRFSTVPRAVAPILPAETVDWAGISFPRDRLWVTVIVVVAALSMGAWFRYSRLGLALRAASENERAIAAAHFSPDVLAAIAWGVASALIGFLAILVSPMTILNPAFYTLAIVPALAVAVVGRLSSITIATAAGLALGSVQSLVVFTSSKPWWPDWGRTGLADAVPFLVLIAALALTGAPLPERGAIAIDPLPAVVRPRLHPAVVGAASAAGLGAVLFTSGSYRFGVITSLVFVLMMLSIVVLTGSVGQISLAQAAFAGAAGFALSTFTTDWSIPFPIAPLLGACVAAALGLVVAIPAVRIRGSQLAVVTLALAVAIERFVFRNSALTGSDGNPIRDPSFLGLDLRVREGRTIARWEFGVMVLVVVVVVTLLTANVLRGRTGLRFLAVRSDERTAAGIGVDVAGTKLLAFAVSSFLAGLAGTLLGYSRGQLSADSFTAFIGLSFLAFAYLGGIGSLSGALIGATFVPLGIGFVVIDRAVPSISTRYLLLSGVALVLTARFNPTGIAGANRENGAALARWWRSRRGRPPAERLTGQALADERSEAETPVKRPDRDLGPPVLEVRDIVVTYGGLRAVDHVGVTVHAGEIVGLIGPNGAGKTTLLDAVSGFVPYTGAISVGGAGVDHAGPHDRARLGLGRSWQSADLFRDLTIRENLVVASDPTSGWSPVKDALGLHDRHRDDRVLDVLRRLELEAAAERLPAELSLGRQKLVSVARALACSPSVVLLDEPVAGLDDRIARRLLSTIRTIADDGMGVLIIDHDTDFMFDVCDRILVLDFGRVIAEGRGGEVRHDPNVIAAYLGDAAAPPRWEDTT